ncbi:tRNA 2-selenouridine synthase [Oikeobacillus pervagus]|uniref:tRNA 2-selenouridine synthase n=1 Tax=Oikeobacillus pervagus TaxID=1325931 RepID=A0AAJ1SZD3_9BACI|nr:tRNA 2-selenouridine(34) synthase MnmH [Oikeobacillus pervagus]MDQ0213997.1 tRNA 2-selenouridine synthase [Oikeobacillus pervagus]
MFQDISIENLLILKQQQKIKLIDVRSESEFENATIPGSMNIPLFNDAERAEVGTIYKQVSVQAAKERGLEIASAKLPQFVQQFAGLSGQKAVFCWRGGMRSKTTATVLDLMGINVFRLEGGYRSYRNWGVKKLDTLQLKPEAYVLNGCTGTGKTTILRRLKKEKDYSILDLEKLANHRGSIFGQIGLEPHNQKKFDALLIEEIEKIQTSPFVLFEGESKRIGRVTLPDFIIKKKDQAIQLFIEIPMEERVVHILDDYKPWNYQKECIEAFSRIKRRIHTPVANQIEKDLKSENYSHAVAQLLEYYYDPLYKHTEKQYPETQKIYIKANDTDDALNQICKWVKMKTH